MGLQWLGKDACSAENVDAVTQVFQTKPLFSPKDSFQEDPNKDDSYMTDSIFKATAEYSADDKLTKIRVTPVDGGKEIIITDEERLNKFEETQKESTSTNRNMGSLISSTAKSTTSITTPTTTTTITTIAPSSVHIQKSGSSFECKGV